MKIHPAIFVAILSSLLCACSSGLHGNVRTYAALEAESARALAQYRRTQLTGKPLQNFDGSDLQFAMFYELPFDERVVFIMNSFATEVLDGEYAENMDLMLAYSTRQHAFDSFHKTIPRETAYTTAIFAAIDHYTDAQAKAFWLA